MKRSKNNSNNKEQNEKIIEKGMIVEEVCKELELAKFELSMMEVNFYNNARLLK